MVPRQRGISTPPSTMEGLSSRHCHNFEQRPLVTGVEDLSNNPDFKESSAVEQEDESEIAKKHHDTFNLIALLPVIITSLLSWWNPYFFVLNWITTFLYFLIDMCWVAIIPICVKSPGVIVKHHIMAMIYLFGPVIWPEYRYFMGPIMSVEINTWFLIFRRVVYKRKDELNPHFISAVNWAFYSSWIIIRCVVYPYIMYEFLRLARIVISESGYFWHLELIFFPVHFFLCILNLKWTYDLFMPIIKKWIGKDVEVTVASGL